MCDICGSQFVKKLLLSMAEPDLRSSLLRIFSNNVLKNQCQNGDCGAEWYECDRSCCLNPSLPCTYTTKIRLTRHLSRFHQPPAPIQATIFNTVEIPARIECPDVRFHVVNHPCHNFDNFEQNSVHNLNPPTHVFESVSLEKHLRNCKIHGYYGAVSRLVCRAAYQDKNAMEVDVASPWLMAFLTIARIVLLTKDEVHELLSSLLSFLDTVIRFFAVKAGVYPDMPLPITLSDFRSMITNHTNTNSIKSILPIPHIHYHENSEHSFSRPTELIAMMMFMPPIQSVNAGVCPRYYSTASSHSFLQKRSQIPAYYLSYQKTIPSILVYITIWSDGWDPNQSTKSNRHPVWTATGTMIFVELGEPDDPYFANTVLMGVGPGKESHEQFFEMMVNEKETKWETIDGSLIPHLFYSKHHKCEVHVFISIGVALQDNPERRGCANLLQGNSNTHGIFGVSCDFKNLSVPFAACDECQVGLEDYVRAGNFEHPSTNFNCQKCLGWSLDKLCMEGRYMHSMDDFLSVDDFGYEMTVRPCRITFSDCISAWNFAIQKFVHDGTWNATRTKSYLKLFCCNDELQKRFVTQAREYINVRESQKTDADESFEDEDLERYRQIHKDGKHQLPKHPAIWSLLDIRDITETPMHLMMGSIKAVLRSMLKFASCRDRQQEFIRRCNEILKTVGRVRVDLVPVMKFKDEKFGGFVAENYSAMAMIVPWLSLIMEQKNMEPPATCAVPNVLIKPHETWNGKECKAWLKQRGHKGCAKLDAAGAKSAVAAYFAGPVQSIPAVVPNPGRDIPVDVVRSLLFYANALFCTIMLQDSEGEPAKNRAQALVALFLSKYEYIDSMLMPGRLDPVWIVKYNLLGLLRVPEHFTRHRHFRNQYEGGSIGEGVVKHLRRLCPNAVRDGWSRNLLKSYYRNQSLDALCQEAQSGWPSWNFLSSSNASSGDLDKYQLQKFRRYRQLVDVKSEMLAGYPVSVVVYRRTGENWLTIAVVLYRHKQPWVLHFMRPTSGAVYLDKFGYCYYPMEINPDAICLTRQKNLSLPGHKFDSYAVMLPDLWKTPKKHHLFKYTLVNEDWQKITLSGEWTGNHAR